jgi:predicted  nucleic acid-binding Zn-ribbon protein
MLAEIEQLLILQDRDQKLKHLRAELATVPVERKRLETGAAARTTRLENARNHLREVELHRKKLELEVKSRQDSIAKFRTQQFQTRKNEEFQALGHEIQRMESEISTIEDQEIELMEEAEKGQAELKKVEAETKTAQALHEQQLKALENKKQVLETRVGEIEKDRTTIAGRLNADLIYQYSRLFQSKGGDAIVAIEHEVCMGCHMKNTLTTVHRAKLARDIVHCEQCGRIVY